MGEFLRNIETEVSIIDLSFLLNAVRESNQNLRESDQVAKEALVPSFDSNREAQLYLKNLKQQYAMELEAVGLEVESEQRVLGNGRFQPSLGIYLNDRRRFVSYLEKLKAVGISKNQADSLARILQVWIQEVGKEVFEERELSDGTIELLGAGTEISRLCREIDPEALTDLSHITKRLETYTEAAKGKYLFEYIMMSRLNMLKGIGPAQWHLDMSPERYAERWDKVLGIMRSLDKKESAKEFYAKQRKRLKESLEYALKEIANKPDFKQRKELLDIAKAALEKLINLKNT